MQAMFGNPTRVILECSIACFELLKKPQLNCEFACGLFFVCKFKDALEW